MNFVLKALSGKEFSNLFELEHSELEKLGIMKMIVDQFPGFPCRISLEDAKIGEEVILLNYKHHNVNTPYQASGPIFVRKIATTVNLNINEIPIMFNHRLLSLRGFNKDGIMKDAIAIEGINLKEQLINTFENKEIEYIHIHNAKPGCYNCSVERA